MNLTDGKISVYRFWNGKKILYDSYLKEFKFGLQCLLAWFYPVVIFQDQKIPKTTGRLSK